MPAHPVPPGLAHQRRAAAAWAALENSGSLVPVSMVVTQALFSLLLLRGTVWSSRYFHKSCRREGQPPHTCPTLGLPPCLPPARCYRHVSYSGFGAKSLLAAVPRIPWGYGQLCLQGPLPHSFILSFIHSAWSFSGRHSFYCHFSSRETEAGTGPPTCV